VTPTKKQNTMYRTKSINSDLIAGIFTDLEEIFNYGIDKSRHAAYTEIIRAEKEEEGYSIQFALPGYDKEDLKISQDKRDLIVSAKFEKEEGWKKSFSKRIQLPDNADFSSSTASLEKGVLKIQIPFKADQKPFEIKIG
jgi:HSP20 family protein